jgi:uncharacterized protein
LNTRVRNRATYLYDKIRIIALGEIVFEFLLAYVISLCIGILAAVLGMGGGFLYFPTLSLVFGFDTRTAIGTSLAVMIFSSISASIWYRKQQIILYKVALVLILPSIIFSVVGSFLTTMIDSRILILIFCIMLVLISLEMLLPHVKFLHEIRYGPSFVLFTQVPTRETQPIARIWYSHLILWGAVGGLLSGITGTSGGAVFVPALMTAGIPMHYAVATSLLTIIAVSITGAATHATLGQISLPFVAVYGAGAALGAFIGANLAPEIDESQIKILFGTMLLIIAAIMFYQKILMTLV